MTIGDGGLLRWLSAMVVPHPPIATRVGVGIGGGFSIILIVGVVDRWRDDDRAMRRTTCLQATASGVGGRGTDDAVVGRGVWGGCGHGV